MRGRTVARAREDEPSRESSHPGPGLRFESGQRFWVCASRKRHNGPRQRLINCCGLLIATHHLHSLQNGSGVLLAPFGSGFGIWGTEQKVSVATR